MRPLIWNKTSVIPVNNYDYNDYTQLFFGSVTLLPREESFILDRNEKPLPATSTLKQNPIGFIWNNETNR